MSLIASGILAYLLANVAADLIVKLLAWRPRMALREAKPRWHDSKDTIDINVIASGKRLDELPPEYRPPGGTADRRWHTQEIRTEQKRAEF